MNNKDTIFALSSGHGKAGVAVIRVSGRNLSGFFHEIFGGRDSGFANRDSNPELRIPNREIRPRHAYLADFYGIDRLVAVFFPAPRSFTGEDVVELHAHGGEAVIQAIFAKLRGFGFRMAERGEFTRRAFDS